MDWVRVRPKDLCVLSVCQSVSLLPLTQSLCAQLLAKFKAFYFMKKKPEDLVNLHARGKDRSKACLEMCWRVRFWCSVWQ